MGEPGNSNSLTVSPYMLLPQATTRWEKPGDEAFQYLSVLTPCPFMCLVQCCELLDLLGVPHLQSRGEAEALCALLNSQGVGSILATV